MLFLGEGRFVCSGKLQNGASDIKTPLMGVKHFSYEEICTCCGAS